MTSNRSPSPALRWTVAVLAGLAGGAAAVLGLSMLVSSLGGNLRAAIDSAPIAGVIIVGAPLLAALAAALAARGAAPSRAVAERDARTSAAPVDPNRTASGDAALQLLALLQQEGRFVDFLEEDITPYSDEQVGAAIRSIHQGCREALRERLELTAILPAAEGETVTIERGFDPAAVRITGNVRGEPPYRGVLRHPGWRSTGLSLPVRTANHDPAILAPAEVEVL